MEKCGDICVKDHLDIISKNTSISWAPFKATIVSVTAKIAHPDYDTRLHQAHMEGGRSLRTIDVKYVSTYLYKNGLYVFNFLRVSHLLISLSISKIFSK